MGDSFRLIKRAVALFIVGITPAFIFAGAYLNRFMPGTEILIDGTDRIVDVSGKTPEEACEYIDEELSELNFKLSGRDLDKSYKGAEIDLGLENGEALYKYFDENRYNPLLCFSGPEDLKLDIGFDEELCDELSLKLSENDDPIEPKAAYVADFDPERGYAIVPEVEGNILKTGAFREFIKEETAGLNTEIVIPDELYKSSRIKKDSSILKERAERLNSLAFRTIIIRFGEEHPEAEAVASPSEAHDKDQSFMFEEKLDGSMLSKWIRDEGGEIKLSEEEIKAYTDSLILKLREYELKGSSADTKKIADESKFSEELSANLSSGYMEKRISTPSEAVEERAQRKAPVTKISVPAREVHKDYRPEFGDKYVEVWLAGQRVRMFENGMLAVETPCVTGNVARGDATPPGTFKLYYKQRNRVLRGEKRPDGSYSYESPVSFWMPFNGGIGLHDATWRGSFGGNIYKYSGSHGCINMPYSAAKAIYEKVEAGTTVHVY